MCRKLLAIVIALSILFSFAIYAGADGAVPTEVMDSVDSVVRVLAEFSDGYATGSGFVVKSDANSTLIATNNHVVEGEPYSITIWMDGEETISARILAASKQKDLCVLELAYPVASLKPLTLDKDGAKKGDAVYAVGYPTAADYLSDTEAHSSAEATITNGIVSAIRQTTAAEYGGEITLLQINAAINPGNSGGPLFDSDGNVVGINTYKADDSEGIFGAIAVNELRTFLSDNGISLSQNPESRGNTMVFLILGALLILLAIAAVVLIVRRKTKNKQKRVKTTTMRPMTLRAFISSRNTPLRAEEAVSLLMPVAVELRKLHDDGKTHLQISPDKVQIHDGTSSLLSATEDEASRYVTGYAAPEIYKGKSAGNLSDIYSFCALLEYAATGRNPQNALERMTAPAVVPQFEAEEDATQAEVENDLQTEAPAALMCDAAAQECMTEDAEEALPAEFTAVIQKGMALAPEDRFETIQTLIYRLTPFNTGEKPTAASSGNETETGVNHPVSKKLPPKKKAGRIAIAVVLTVIIAVAAVAGIYFWRYTKAVSLAETGSYKEAEDTLLFARITDWHDPEFNKYLAAGCLLEDRKYADAQSVFTALGDYRDAEQMVQESQYRRAAQLTDANEYDEALIIYNDLKNAGYKDSEDCWYETRYRKAVYQLYELGESKVALDAFVGLSKEGYQKADAMISEAQYYLACDLIEEEQYINAYTILMQIDDYPLASETLSALKDTMYLLAQTYYYAGNNKEAVKIFERLRPYQNSDSYLTLIYSKGGPIFALANGATVDYGVDALVKIFYFEDAADILVSQQSLACDFLMGYWRTSDGYYYFEMKESASDEYKYWCSYNLPWFDGDGFTIIDGIYYLSVNDTRKKMFRFELLTPDSMNVYCYKNGKTYTLYR